MCAILGNALLPGTPLSNTAFAIVGMSSFFTAVVRAPLTGIALIAEMTATTTQVIPMLIAAAAAMTVCVMLRSEPIYDALRRRMEQAT
jgi:chloride channel protein, CIC family